MSEKKASSILSQFNPKDANYEQSKEIMTFEQYLDLVIKKPAVARSAVQRIYDMVLSYGTEPSRKVGNEEIPRYLFFDDPFSLGKEEFEKGRKKIKDAEKLSKEEIERAFAKRKYGEDAIFGIEDALAEIVAFLEGAARSKGSGKRFLILHGPVASAKSTIGRLLRKGLEEYSKTDDGALYTFDWSNLGCIKTEREQKFGFLGDVEQCYLHEDPLMLLPADYRSKFLQELNKEVDPLHKIVMKGDLCPQCHFHYGELMDKKGGDWQKILKEHITVKRMIISEKDEKGLAVFQPRDEKNQDSTELTGDTNFSKLSVFGDEAHPMSFSHTGEFQKANRGILEWVEVLKLNKEFLYELLEGTQDRIIKPKNQPRTSIDELLFGHTNNPEFVKLIQDESMEAFRNRIWLINAPYNTELSEEIKIYEKEYSNESCHKHIAPFTLYSVAFWTILSRLQEPEKIKMLLEDKLKLYDGKVVKKEWGSEEVKELKAEAPFEGFFGISPRFVQDTLTGLLVKPWYGGHCINSSMAFSELEEQIKVHASIKDNNQRARFNGLIELAKGEYNAKAKEEMMKAICADDEEMKALFEKYRDNVLAYMLNKKVKDRHSRQEYSPDEKFMRIIEDKMSIDPSSANEHRTTFLAYMTEVYGDNREFDFTKDEALYRGLQLYLFDQKRRDINFAAFYQNIRSSETNLKLDTIKGRLIDNMGYCDECASNLIVIAGRLFQEE
ncbi:MAG: serine protein kinase [Candidatus Woesearchaeota archaeon]